MHAHRPRHSVAPPPLGQGGSLAEIGELLQHKATIATAIHARTRRTRNQKNAPSPAPRLAPRLDTTSRKAPSDLPGGPIAMSPSASRTPGATTAPGATSG